MNDHGQCEVRPLSDADTRRAWLHVPKLIHAGDPAWICPLDIVEKQRISPGRNPFFEAGEAEFFVAYRNGVPAGRISAQINRRYLERHRDATGHFGFFDCIDDPIVAKALVGKAEAWLAERGMTAMQGPFSLSVNQDTGLLASGFEHRPTIMTSHARTWTGGLLEACGMKKVMDFYAYRMNPDAMPDKARRLAELAKASGRLVIRNIDMSNYAAEARLIFDIFNDAWSDNWGFVPISDREAVMLAAEMKPIMRAKFAWIVEIDGEPAAMMVVLPDLNEVIGPFNGRLLPFNWAKLAYAIWRDDWRTARVPLLGIRSKHRSTSLAAGALSVLVAGLRELGRSYRIDWVEYSWVLESNAPMVALAELVAGKPAKIYRAYGKALSASPGLLEHRFPA